MGRFIGVVATATIPVVSMGALAPNVAAIDTEMRALVTMSSCVGSFMPTTQSTPEGGSSGALKLGFESIDQGVVTISWEMGVDAYKNPHDPKLAFPNKGTLRNAKLANGKLTASASNGAQFDLVVTMIGGKPVVTGPYTRFKGDKQYTLNNCGG